MTRLIIIVVGLAILGFIYLRHAVKIGKRVTLKSLLFRQKNIFRHHEDTTTAEITVDEMIPNEDGVAIKDQAKGEAFLKKADIQMRKGDLGEAERMLIQVLTVDPSSVETYKRLGVIYLQQGQYGKAEGIYRKLIVSVVDNPTLYSNLGMALYSQKKLEEAKGFYVKALEYGGERAGRFFSLGKVMQELGDIEGALLNYKKALEMDGENLDYLLTVAELFVDENRVAEAEALLGGLAVRFADNEEVLRLQQKLRDAG